MPNSLRPSGAIAGIVVTFEPDLERLQEALAALRPQVSSVIVVDNCSHSAARIRVLTEDIGGAFLPLARNEGIGAAQNRGIERALSAGATAVLLMDQDTILDPGAVDALVAARNSLLAKGFRVGAVGPAYRNSHDGQIAPVWRAGRRRLMRIDPNLDACEWTEADFVIASGSLLSAEALGAIGGMDETMFIDLVDLEWGFRASSKGFRHFVCHKALMTHTLGSKQMRFFRRRVTVHTPVRNYYWVRNAIALARKGYVPTPWKRYFLTYIPRFLLFYSIFADHGFSRLCLMTRGVWDGLTGRGGSFDRRQATGTP